ncbi:hypothetical protein MTPG_00017 [Methylophilales phage HIM624-A]|nr:hypothetical protein MTPG_00017 [Methylophilales phage HIM624-A]
MEVLYEEPGNGFIGLSFNETLQAWVLHTDCKAWSVSEFKRYLKIMEIVKSDLKARGITEVYGICADKKAVRFNKMFGAKPTGHFAKMNTDEYELITKLEI